MIAVHKYTKRAGREAMALSSITPRNRISIRFFPKDPLRETTTLKKYLFIKGRK
jgi:hypothetical protein